MRRWLARLAFPGVILAFVLAYEGMHSTGPRSALLYAGAVVCLIIGLAGVRERHRM